MGTLLQMGHYEAGFDLSALFLHPKGMLEALDLAAGTRKTLLFFAHSLSSSSSSSPPLLLFSSHNFHSSLYYYMNFSHTLSRLHVAFAAQFVICYVTLHQYRTL